MFVGHYSSSLAAKRVAPEVPLWLLFVAAQWVDIVWAVLILAGIERMQITPGITASNALDLQYVPFTHSLPAALLWSVGFAGAAAAALPSCRSARAFWTVAAVTASHWLLDLIVHRPDLPLWGSGHKVGLGLWNLREIALLFELALLAASAWWLSAGRKIAAPIAARPLWIFVGALMLLHMVNIYGPPPQSVLQVGVGGLTAYIVFAAIAGWIEARSRRAAQPSR